MKKSVKIRLDGKTVEAPEGSTILDVAKEEGVYIPTLCYSPMLRPLENCRLCVVAVAGERQFKPACSTPVVEGMDITTHSEELQQTRKLLLELLLDTHYGDCVAPCTVTCPANVDIQGYLALIRNGEYLEAVKLIKEKIPMPATIGRVCPHPCEGACRRHLVDEPVNINHCKRFVADYEIESGTRILPSVPEPSGRHVAIIGGGPAGLSAAYYLRALGHGATIFEARDKLGGMLRYGIPEYRLPKKILDWEIEGILSLGVSVRTGVKWGQDFTLDDLKKEGFDAVFLAIGAWGSRKLGIVGEDLQGVISGVEFLEKIASGEPVYVGKRVVIIGGGNVAIDAARSALRLGAEQVTILYRRSRKEMPASPEEIEAAEAEGVDIKLLAAPSRALGENGVLKQLEFIRMELGEPDASGRRRPVPIEGSETLMEADQLIAAIGQFPEIVVPENDGIMEKVPITRWSTVGGDPKSMYTGHDLVFVGGDLFQGPMTVVAALADGRKAAYSINRSFEVGEVQPEPLHFNISKGDLDEIDRSPFEVMKTTPRERMPELATAKRINNFMEVELGLTEEQARHEASRCLVCGCSAAFDCRLREFMNEFQVDWREQPSKKIPHQRVAAIDVHPNIALDPNKCIRCERCVVACTTLQCSDAIDFKDWPKFTDRCVSCGLCVDLCPTGAIMEKRGGRAVDRLDWQTVSTHCVHCGCGCQLDLKLKGERLVWIADGQDVPPSHGLTCRNGRFHAYDTHWYGERITKPMVRQNGSLQEVSWGKAIETLLQGFKVAVEKEGSQSIAALASPRASNEALYLLQKWLRFGWQCNSMDFPGREVAERFFTVMKNVTGSVGMSQAFGAVDQAQAILVWGGDLEKVSPVVATQIRKAIRRNNAVLYEICDQPTELTSFASMALHLPKDVWASLAQFLAGAVAREGEIADAIAQKMGESLETLKSSTDPDPGKYGIAPETLESLKNMVISAPSMALVVPLSPADSSAEIKADVLWKSLLQLAVLKNAFGGNAGAGFYPCLQDVNTLGALLMGVSPNKFPGFTSINDLQMRGKLQSLWEMEELVGTGGINLLRALHEKRVSSILVQEGSALWEQESTAWQEALKKASFVALMDCVKSPALDLADVVLPVAAFGEQEGTVINQERRVLRLEQAMKPDGGSMGDWEIMSQIMAAQGIPFPRDLAAIREEISKIVPELEGYPWEEVAVEEAVLPWRANKQCGTLRLDLDQMGELKFEA